MQDREDPKRVAARLALAGIKRDEAAGAAHVSYSAINRKLRGQRPLSTEDARRLNRLAVPVSPTETDGQP